MSGAGVPVHCFDAATGRRHWSHDTKGMAFAPPLVAGARVVVATHSGDVTEFAAAAEKKVLAVRELDAGVVAPPVAANGTLYVLTEKRLYAVGGGK